jgi:type I restriction enzyme R subunit
MATFDTADRQARGEQLPDDIKRLLNQLVAESTASGEVLDIYEAAGMPRPTLTDLTPSFLAQAQQASNPHLAIEALRAMLTEESTRATGGNVVRQRAFSERITELMRRYTNQQLTSAEVIAELIELAREVAAEGNRGARFSPPLGEDELAFFDAVAQNESAVAEQGEGVLPQIARDLVGSCGATCGPTGRCATTCAPSSARRSGALLVKHGYPPDKQPAAIKLVLEQMESMAPRYAADRK